jgi:predicted enzyme related to lactoylglutathione lyase
MRLLINIDVPDLIAAERFYRSAFGLTVGRRFEGAVELLGGPAPLYLLEKAAGSIAAGSDPRRYERHWTPVHLDVVVEDLETAVERATTAGAAQESGISDTAWGRIALMADPFGNGFCLLSFSAQGYDAIST